MTNQDDSQPVKKGKISSFSFKRFLKPANWKSLISSIASSTRASVSSALASLAPKSHARPGPPMEMPKSSETNRSSGPGRPGLGKLVFSSKLSRIKDQLVDITPSATPCRFRFVDCNTFLDASELSLYEFEELPSDLYAAVSYVWRGNRMVDDPTHPYYWPEQLGTFAVKGAEDGDPISLDVLWHVCIAASPTAQYLWLDRLCIMQTSKNDKAWQINQMYSIYNSCETCYVLPGGVQRLVGLREQTAWIYRAWTLQEALVPKHTVVLFWCHNGIMPRSPQPNLFNFRGVEVVPGKSGYAELRHLLEESQVDEWTSGYSRMCNLFGRGEEEGAALYGALTASDENEDLKHQAIWRSALLRTSSRPVDMVFSIMHLFGVFLEPLKFGKEDRMGATIALAREILARGGKASWMGSLYSVPPSYRLSTFPRFPHTTVAEYIKAREMEWRPTHWVSGLPGGSMDEEGYFSFTAEAVPVICVKGKYTGYSGLRLTKRRKIFLHSARAVWLVNDTTDPSQLKFPRAFAVSIGRILEYSTTGMTESSEVNKPVPRQAPEMDVLLSDSSFKMDGRNSDSDSNVSVDMNVLGDRKWIRELQLIVVEHAPEKFHKADSLELKVNYMRFVKGRRAMDFSVGGPIAPSVSEEEAEKLGSVYYDKYGNDSDSD